MELPKGDYDLKTVKEYLEEFNKAISNFKPTMVRIDVSAFVNNRRVLLVKKGNNESR